ncbi:MAG: endonuclease domain-containing protein [Alphaproteobacteria bacterium]|nr:endonuclease domain-containing protein [Alphaproteobacteria bacterium]
MTDAPFIFENYFFDAQTGILSLHYRYEGGARFEERITFPHAPHTLPVARKAAFDAACRLIFLLAGVSYYKAFVPRELKCEAFALTRDWAPFVEEVYRKGLGEFAYRNKLDLSDRVHFETRDGPGTIPTALSLPHRLLVPVGGGKDSIVSIEALRKTGLLMMLYAQGKAINDIAAPILATIDASRLPSVKVGRAISPEIITLNKNGAYNGHVPITAILSSMAVASAILYGFDTVVLSNEHSASAPNLVENGVEINHQYSKSLDFEKAFAGFVASHIAPDLHYFSLLRPLTEAAIARRFAKLTPYHQVFRSCNTAFRQDKEARGTKWCCDCPKCRFVFLALAPFMDKENLVAIFGKNMLNDIAQEQGFAELVGLDATKPFECVGEIEESALLMGKLARSEAWKNDAVVKDLGEKLMLADFDARYEEMFKLRGDHCVPPEFLRVLDESR